MSGPFDVQPAPIFMDIPTHEKLTSLNIFLILFDCLARDTVVLEDLFSNCLPGVNFISFGRWKEINIHFPLCLFPKWCSEPELLLFPLFWHRWLILTFARFILFLTPMIWWRCQRTQLSLFFSQSVGKNCLILELCPLPSFIPSLHKHKKRRGEISANNTRQDSKIVVWISPCPVRLKWYCMSYRVKYSYQKSFTAPCLLVWNIVP